MWSAGLAATASAPGALYPDGAELRPRSQVAALVAGPDGVVVPPGRAEARDREGQLGADPPRREAAGLAADRSSPAEAPLSTDRAGGLLDHEPAHRGPLTPVRAGRVEAEPHLLREAPGRQRFTRPGRILSLRVFARTALDTARGCPRCRSRAARSDSADWRRARSPSASSSLRWRAVRGGRSRCTTSAREKLPAVSGLPDCLTR